MHSVLIVSDSHGLTDELEMIKSRHKVDEYIHCGDSELAETATQLDGFITVKGNCDWNGKFPNEQIVEFGGLRFFITHGHLYGVKQSLLQLQYKAEEVEADVVCFGHSHIAYAEKVRNTLFINPSSIRSPNKYKEKSYAMIEWENRDEITVHFYDLSGRIITTFPYESHFQLK